MTTPISCTAAFREAGLILWLEFSNIILIRKMGFDATECIKVRRWELSYIQNLINKQIQLAQTN